MAENSYNRIMALIQFAPTASYAKYHNLDKAYIILYVFVSLAIIQTALGVLITACLMACFEQLTKHI
jgi:high-affinity K+ transport system ATPase subunit B